MAALKPCGRHDDFAHLQVGANLQRRRPPPANQIVELSYLGIAPSLAVATQRSIADQPADQEMNAKCYNSIKRKLSDEEMAAYRQPFLNAGGDRRPT